MKQIKNYWALIIPILVLVIAFIFFIGKNHSQEDELIGMVDATSIDVAAELPGRLDSLLVSEGDTVQAGQLLAVLRSTEVQAIRAQAQAAIQAAEAQRQLLQNGARPELIEAANKLYQVAQEQYNLFNTTYQRMQNLYNAEVISGQEKDVFYFKYQASKREMETAKLNLEMLKQGTRPEIKKAADAMVQQAEQAYQLTSALNENARVYAPATGIISNMVIHQGEIVAVGYPMMTIQKEDSYIIRFNVRQDQSNTLKAGAVLAVRVPGCQPEIFNAKVVRISPTLEFANWMPAKNKGQFELRTFTIELKPVNVKAIKGLRPGMTASLNV